jgi:hypothetical protein
MQKGKAKDYCSCAWGLVRERALNGKERKKEKHIHTHKLNTNCCVCFSAFDNGGMLLLHSELV